MEETYHYNNLTTRKKTPKSRLRSTVEFDFLQYSRVVFKWAVTNYDLNRGQIEMLLYLYPKGAFSSKQYSDYQKTIGMYQGKEFKKLKEGGWVSQWRLKKGKQCALYTLTFKAKLMCRRMHNFCVGKEEMPLTHNNAIVTNTDVRINRYYLDIIKKMNKNKGVE